MQFNLFTDFDAFKQNSCSASFQDFLQQNENGNFFQSAEFFQFVEDVPGYQPFLLIARTDSEAILGSLLGVFQSNGSGLKSWLSRRLIIWGGPLLAEGPDRDQNVVARALIVEMKKHARGSAIYAEFRNFFDTSDLKASFEKEGFNYRPHLNYLVKTDEEAAVKKRMSKSRIRQIKSSFKLGASIAEAENEGEVMIFYTILQQLYKEKIKKPLPSPDLFLKFWKSSLAKIFVVKHQDKVVGGIACPVFANKVIYEWYICGIDGLVKGLHPSVLATWAPIEYGLNNGFDHFDFMGAGKPDQDYGVREFKARFGGEEVCYGRYEMILNQPLYKLGKLGLKVYQKIK